MERFGREQLGSLTITSLVDDQHDVRREKRGARCFDSSGGSGLFDDISDCIQHSLDAWRVPEVREDQVAHGEILILGIPVRGDNAIHTCGLCREN